VSGIVGAGGGCCPYDDTAAREALAFPPAPLSARADFFPVLPLAYS
jgi:hypothetical protein